MATSAQEPPSPPPGVQGQASGTPARFKPRNWTKADIYIRPTTPPVLVKDYRGRNLLARLYGRLCLNQEERALKRLAGIRGVPALVAREGPCVLAMEFIQAKPLRDLRKTGGVPPDFLDRLEELFLAIEARGVAHGDPHMRNILCGPDGQPYLVDFSTSYVLGRVPLVSRRIFHNLQVMRQLKIQRLRRKLYGQHADTSVRPGLAYRIIHYLGHTWRRRGRRRKKSGAD